MPKSKYVTITLTQHEADLARCAIETACLGDSNSQRRADLGRAINKISQAWMNGHNKAPTASLVARLARSLDLILTIDGAHDSENRIIPYSVRVEAEKLIAKVQGKGAGT